MNLVRRRLSATRADAVEQQLQARAAQLKPKGAPPAAPLGYCRACQTAVYTGDSYAMAGVYLLHGDCTLDGSASTLTRSA